MALLRRRTLTPAELATRRSNAKMAAARRAGAGHARALLSEPARRAMLALGEDPAEFERACQDLRRLCPPGDPLAARLAHDLAKLYWRKGRLERARDALLRLEMEDVERSRQSLREELGAFLRESSGERILRLCISPKGGPAARLALSLAYVEAVRARVARREFGGYQRAALERLPDVAASPRATPLELQFRQIVLAVERGNSPEDRDCENLLKLLDEEIASLRERLDRVREKSERPDPAARDERLLALSEPLNEFSRQENFLDRAIDRKTKVFISYLRTRRALRDAPAPR